MDKKLKKLYEEEIEKAIRAGKLVDASEALLEAKKRLKKEEEDDDEIEEELPQKYIDKMKEMKGKSKEEVVKAMKDLKKEEKCKEEEEEDEVKESKKSVKEAVKSIKESKKTVKKEAKDHHDDEEDDDDLEEAKKSYKKEAKDHDEEDDDDLEEAKKSYKKEAKDHEEDEDDHHDEEDDDDDDDLKEAKKKKKSVKKEAKDHHDEEDDDDDDLEEGVYSQEDLAVLLESETNLTEEFQVKAKTLFDVAVKQRVKKEKERLEEEYETRIAEAAEESREWLTDKIDGFLTEAVESWAEENKVAVESSIRADLAESFISGLKQLFEDHYVDIPETKRDILEETEQKYNKLDEDAKAVSRAYLDLIEENKNLKREKILSDLSEGLTESQAEKLESLTEDVEFSDEDEFTNKVKIIRNAYFTESEKFFGDDDSSSTTTTKGTRRLVEDVEDNNDDESANLSPKMKKYLSAIKKAALAQKKN